MTPRRKTGLRIGAYSLLILSLLAGASCGEKEAKDPAGAGTEGDGSLQADPLLADARAVGSLTMELRWADASRQSQRVELFRDGRQVWARSGHRFAIESRVNEQASTRPVGQGVDDITGDGVPDLVIREFTGQPGRFVFIVVGLGPEVREIATIEARHEGAFIDVNGDGRHEFVGTDWTFDGWKAPASSSPAPRVVLTFEGGAYVLAPSLMQRPEPTPEQIEQLIIGVLRSNEWQGGNPPPALWGTALDMMFSGHPELGWSFLELAWPEGQAGYERFLGEFRAQLLKSPYAAALGL
ncbi:MAG: VCBS repeat-containing protein [Phycisphaeraceae bacterium]|nr:VCBS repeat-containing protein [Phycisphaeraceae bacterium]MCW5753677.1 VCBS repeat-containing protein [Phycisphaeraceae bacterium]